MITRRTLLGTAGAAAAAMAAPARKRRTMYFNDARHFYLYSFDPPMSDEDSWRPIDELLGTAVNTLIYGVETGGLFSRSKVAPRAFSNNRPYTSALAWRAWYNMQSLIDRGLDPLRVVIDRAHDKGLDFITSMRVGGGKLDFARKEVRDGRFAWLEELAGYPVEGIELDLTYSPHYFQPAEARANAPVMSAYVRDIAAMVRSKGNNRIVGARVFPTVAMNEAIGLDVKEWLAKRYVDYVAPMFYGFHQLDPHLPFESLVAAAKGTGAEVFPVIQPFYIRKDLTQENHATPAMLRAAVANLWAKGATGLIVAPWFRWPLRDAEKSFLTDIGDPDAVRDRDKHYIVPHREEEAVQYGYGQPLPLVIARADPNARFSVPLYIADDFSSKRIRSVRLLLKVMNMVGPDQFAVRLNGASLESEPRRRTSHRYGFQWLDYTLTGKRPRRGENLLEFTLASRPEGLEGGVTVEQVEVAVDYGLPSSMFERPLALEER
ncbi:MAG: hypothetical protein FJW38_15315 [Acidobacteria bacterium]|nr:hypothetical protein [Acidobacteriota bacterium]